ARIGGIGTVSGRAPLAPGGLPGFTGPFPSTSLDKGVCACQVRARILPVIAMRTLTRRGHNGLTLALASLGFVSLGLPEGMLGVPWPSIRAAFGLPLDALGLLLATFATGYFVASALSGRVFGRWAVGSVLAASCATTGLSLIGYAISPVWSTMVALG